MPRSARLLTALMLAVLGAVGAWWAIALAYPTHEPVAIPQIGRAAPPSRLAEVAERLSRAPEAVANLDVRLLGVVSSGAGSRAVVLAQGKPATLAVGEALAPGATIAAIGADYIDVINGAARSRIELAVPVKTAKGAKP